MLIALAVWGDQAHALGLGAIALESGLGRPLQARIPVYGLSADEAGANCVKSRVLALEGGLLSRPVAEVTGSGAATVLKLRTVESISEPAINVSVEIGCTNSVKREYQVLLDPVPATLPMAAAAMSASTERPERAQRKAATRTGIVAAPVDPEISTSAGSNASVPPAPKPPAIVAHMPAAPAKPKPKPVAETKSVLTLAGGDAEIEQIRARIALRSATVLSEPRVETDPARLAALRADQARVAALLRGEDPLAGTQAQLHAAQENLLAAQKSAASAARLHQQEKAAMAATREDMVSGKLLAVLGALLLACVAAIAWLLWRRADDRRRQEQAFFAMTAEQDAFSALPLQHQNEGQTQASRISPAFAEPAAPVFATGTEAESMDFAMPADEVIPAPAPSVSHQIHDWGAEAGTLMVASTPPDPLQLPQSWMTLENHNEDSSEQTPGFVQMPSPVSPSNDNAQAHAAEVANMLMAAESWMAEHNPMRAAEVLRPYLARDEMQSPAPALYLLSLYRTMNDKGQIAIVLAQLEQDFPAEAAAWNDPGQPRRSIADFPLVHAAVDSLSDSAKLLPYLNSLLLAPEQFDFSTYREIVRAIGLACEMKQESELRSMSLDFQ